MQRKFGVLANFFGIIPAGFAGLCLCYKYNGGFGHEDWRPVEIPTSCLRRRWAPTKEGLERRGTPLSLSFIAFIACRAGRLTKRPAQLGEEDFVAAVE